MPPFPNHPDLLAVAARVVWFKAPADALAPPFHFMAHVMTYGTAEDVLLVEAVVEADAFLETLTHAPPGIFDARS